MKEVAFQTNPRDFFDACASFLEKDAVEHNLIFSLCRATAKKMQEGRKADIRCCAFSDEGGFVVAAVQTPPHNLVLSKARHTDFAGLVNVLAQNKSSFPGIVGPRDVVESFAAQWAAATGEKFSKSMDQYIYELKKLVMPPPADGEWRFATEDDADLLAAWIAAFVKEALPEEEWVSAQEAKERAGTLIAEKRMVFWTVNGRPVAQAGFSGTLDMPRISFVYTPPENRGRRFSATLVAHLSEALLEQGSRMCCLYTDANNAVSNAVYRKIGYVPVGQSCLYLRAADESLSKASLNSPESRT